MENNIKPIDLQSELVDLMGDDLFKAECKEDIHEALMRECAALISQNEAYQDEDAFEVCEAIYMAAGLE